MTPEQLTKLPKWAQEKVASLQRQRDDAVEALNAAVSGDTPTKVYYHQMVSTGEKAGPQFKRFFIPDNTVCFQVFGDVDERHDKGVVMVSLRLHDAEPNVSISFDAHHMAIVPNAGNSLSVVSRKSDWQRRWEAERKSK